MTHKTGSNKYHARPISIILIQLNNQLLFVIGHLQRLCRCEASHSVSVVDFLHGHDVSRGPDVQSKVVLLSTAHNLQRREKCR